MGRNITCKKTTDGNKIIFYSQKFSSLWQYYKVLGTQRFIFFLVLLSFSVIIMGMIKEQSISGGFIGVVFILLICFMGLIHNREKNYFFELSANKKEISFYAYRQQWSYKVAAIEKIIKGDEVLDLSLFAIFFVVRIEGESKTIEVFDCNNKFLQVYDVVQILKEICAYTGLKFETESGRSLLP